MFEADKAQPEHLRDLILTCETRRDILEAPAWKQYIDTTVNEKALNLVDGRKPPVSKEIIVPAGATIRHAVYGEGQVVGMVANFAECATKLVELPYLRALPDEVSYCAEGNTLLHEKFGEGTISAFIVVFPKNIMKLCYPKDFEIQTLVFL